MTGRRVDLGDLGRFCRAVLRGAGADAATAEAATRAMLHGSRLGIDSHGVRLLPHYVRALLGGRVNPRPELRFEDTDGAVARLDADDAHGALAAYAAMNRAIALAGRFGIGAVGVRRSSHFGPAGAFALPAAEAQMIGLVTCNSDSFVRLHDGAERFHGTNPIACAAPVPGQKPWLLDMATSAVPYNRVQLYASLGEPLPAGVASDGHGIDTTRPDAAEMLAPLGAGQGYKGAGLAGLVAILSAALTGARLDFEALPMPGPDFATPRDLGAFVVALKPEAFGDGFGDAMTRYLRALRGSAPRAGATVLAPGDREWAEARRRDVRGVPLDTVTVAAFAELAREFALPLPAAAEGRAEPSTLQEQGGHQP